MINPLPAPVVLGLDFLKYFRVAVDYEDRTWKYKDRPWEIFEFETSEDEMDQCNGIRE